MGFTGLCPAEASSGDTARRGHITKAGPQPVRTALVESALAYRHPPAIGAVLRRRQRGGLTPPRKTGLAPGHPWHAVLCLTTGTDPTRLGIISSHAERTAGHLAPRRVEQVFDITPVIRDGWDHVIER